VTTDFLQNLHCGAGIYETQEQMAVLYAEEGVVVSVLLICLLLCVIKSATEIK
jgi:hypothetical protein